MKQVNNITSIQIFAILPQSAPEESTRGILVYDDRETAERHLSLMNQYDMSGPFKVVTCEVEKLTQNKAKRNNIVKLLLYKQENKCCYCEKTMSEVRGQRVRYQHDDITIEHISRITDGGSNDLNNIALACDECNRGRGDIDWMTYKSYKMNEIVL